MSKQRRNARAERERVSAERAATARAEQDRAAADRERRERRRQAWRRIRLWQHGAGFRRTREQWGVIAVIALVVLLVVYFVTGSLADVVGAVLALVICMPVLAMLFVDRSRK